MKFDLDLVKLENLVSQDTEHGRVYSAPSGEKFFSITTVLGRQEGKNKSLDEWRARVGDEEADKVSRVAARRGTSLHSMMEDYIVNGIEPHPIKTMPFNYALFKRYKKAVDKNLTVVRGSELPLYSPFLKVAGRCDLVGMWDGVLSVIDFKTSKRLKEESWIKDYFLQTTAYSIMFEELTKLYTPQIVVLIAVDDEDEPQVFVKRRVEYKVELQRILDEDYNKYGRYLL